MSTWKSRALTICGRASNWCARPNDTTASFSTERRPAPLNVREAVQKMRDGIIGETYMARGLCYKWRDTIGKTPVQAVPQASTTICGPGRRLSMRLRKIASTTTGIGSGITAMAILETRVFTKWTSARWGMGLGFPNKVSAIGGHFMFDDDQQTPNDLNCAFEFNLPNGKRRMITFEVRHWITNHEAEIGTPALGTPEQRGLRYEKLGPMSGNHNTSRRHILWCEGIPLRRR